MLSNDSIVIDALTYQGSPHYTVCTSLQFINRYYSMNTNEKILEILTKISNTLEEIKAQGAMSAPTPSRVPAKLPPPPAVPASGGFVLLYHFIVPSAPKSAEKTAPAVPKQDMDFYSEFVVKYVKPVVDASNTLGEKYVVLVWSWAVFSSRVRLLILCMENSSRRCKQPDQNELTTLFTPVKESLSKVDLLDKDRDFPQFYVKTMREIISIVNWVNMVESD